MTDPTTAEDLAVRVAPLGSKSGDTRWEAAQMIRAQAAEIERLRAELDERNTYAARLKRALEDITGRAVDAMRERDEAHDRR